MRTADNVYTGFEVRQTYLNPALVLNIDVTLGEAHDLSVFLPVKCKKLKVLTSKTNFGD